MLSDGYRRATRSMKAPFHMRGPCMAKLWLLFALAIIGIQMVFVVNLLVKKSSGLTEPDAASLVGDFKVNEGKPDAEKLTADSEEHYRENTVVESSESGDQASIESAAHAKTRNFLNQLAEPPAKPTDQTTTVGPLEDNNPMFNFLRNAVEQVFDGKSLDSGASGDSGSAANPLSQINALMPLMALLPALNGGHGPGGSGMASVNWEKYMPMLERVERFAKYCAVTFSQTVKETKEKHRSKAKEPSFISAVAMKGFFRIFSDEFYQEEFLEVADDSYGLLEGLGVVDHVIDLVSGRLYEKVLKDGGVPADGNFLSGGAAGLAAIFLKGEKDQKSATTSTTSTTTADPNRDAADDEEEVDVEEDDEDKAALVSNEHFESIMEVYDYMFREEETHNATAAKLELAGRMFLQTWYGAMRRYAIEKGKLHAKPLTDITFEKYLESVEVPFSNILDYAYPIKNEKVCEKNPPKLLIMVTSKTHHIALRNAIRQTWGITAPPSDHLPYKVLFLLTDRDEDRHMVLQESTQYGDIVSVDVPQTYEYVTRKALVALDWPVAFCPAAGFVFKTTDQLYLNISTLQTEISRQQNAQLMGDLSLTTQVQRVPLKLDHLFYDEYPFDRFTAYLKGASFLASMAFAKNAIGIAKDFPLLRTDDYTLTGLLSAKLKVTPVGYKQDGVTNLEDAPWVDTQKTSQLICQKKSSVVFGGKLSAPKVLFIHATLNSCPV